LTERNLVVKSRNKAKLFSPLVALSLILAGAIIIGTTVMPSEMVNGQNATGQNATGQNATGQNATGQNATGQMENASAIDQVSTAVLETLAAPGYANKYDVMVDGQPLPLSYNIIGGQLVGMLANPDRHALYLALNPSGTGDGGAVEVQLPRNFIDSKGSGDKDKPYTVVMDGDRISGEPSGICLGDCPNIFNSFKQTGESNTDRVLTIVFGPESRFVEIIGDK
jgi:hypothetical protein